jgi:hypothetical protein
MIGTSNEIYFEHYGTDFFSKQSIGWALLISINFELLQ